MWPPNLSCHNEHMEEQVLQVARDSEINGEA